MDTAYSTKSQLKGGVENHDLTPFFLTKIVFRR